MPSMNYTSSATKEVTPTIIAMHFTINVDNTDVDAAVAELNTKRKESRLHIFKKDSLITDSYTQTNISVTPQFKTVAVKKKIDDVEKTINERVFDTYRASTTIRFLLKNDETVIEDFTDILNMTIKLKSKCLYEFEITDAERETYQNELTAIAVDKGLNAVKEIIDKSEALHDLIPKIVEINTIGSCGNNIDYSVAKCRGAIPRPDALDEEYPSIVTPEIVHDMFTNKKIVLMTSLNLIIDLRSSRAI